ncbi:cell envelope integrity protein CreD [Flavihumibacter petaseus]|uniref:Inner membrane protein CreD n=1 Tax=Flavihumibacter petaseus NBRC 106054 TaxID=1220578 RepID=A0A0E9MVB4_9BACT|nr:cell envelope integrity protein CreD [Flavihumibacter petaseus]GAO41702.1 hypothetical protein FPE01S_01_07160 [Flavihumibacter petaseus NBRC 106054]
MQSAFEKSISPLGLSFRIWGITQLVFSTLVTALLMQVDVLPDITVVYYVPLISAFLGLPAWLILRIALGLLASSRLNVRSRLDRLRWVIVVLGCGYGLAAGLVLVVLWQQSVTGFLTGFALLNAAFFIGCITQHSVIMAYFHVKPHPTAEARPTPAAIHQEQNRTLKKSYMEQTNKVLYKAIITALLILLLLIPSVFIQNLVQERKSRQAEVVHEVSSRWAAGQTLSGFYLYLPYVVSGTTDSGKPYRIEKQLIVLPEEANVQSVMEPEVRPRSIYKVLLYKSRNVFRGQFRIAPQGDFNLSLVKWQDARLCLNISDIKGIEEKVLVKLQDQQYEMQPGTPETGFGNSGLSLPLASVAEVINGPVSFESVLRLKGSEQLHFLPLAGNSIFTISSPWPSPSFDGSYLPGTREVSDSGFQAKWSFSKANLPFNTYLSDTKFDAGKFGFGITMVQPADQYAKTERSVKYAILVIGLTFSLFFIMEQILKKPVHPVQYVLIGLALTIFYTLLLSISEFLFFDWAYLIAATATIVLITWYVRGHFKSFRTAALLGAVITMLYGFIFVLVRLEDTALLIGSIGLFLILGLAMYGSRKVNWYGNEQQQDQPRLASTE